MTVCALVLLTPLVAGGDTLSGRVMDRDGHAVAGATMVVVELHRVAISQTDGRFRFADIPAGRYTLTVRGLGFAPLARQVTVSGSTTLDLTGAEIEVATRQTRLNPLDIPTGGYTLLNLSAGFERPLAGRACHVDLTVRNATNVSYRSFLSRYKEFALDPGRNVVLRISLGN